MSQHLTFVERIRSALGHSQRLVPAPVASAVQPAQDKGVAFAERLRAALPPQRRLPR